VSQVYVGGGLDPVVGGKKIATIAIARKLLTRAWHLLNDLQAASADEPLRRP
jgi:hypothetical protein